MADVRCCPLPLLLSYKGGGTMPQRDRCRTRIREAPIRRGLDIHVNTLMKQPFRHSFVGVGTGDALCYL